MTPTWIHEALRILDHWWNGLPWDYYIIVGSECLRNHLARVAWTDHEPQLGASAHHRRTDVELGVGRTRGTGGAILQPPPRLQTVRRTSTVRAGCT